jgi:predicted Zn-dependent protease
MMRRLLPAVGVLVAACSNIASPAVNDIYEYRAFEFGDTLAFHWPRELLPVRIWVAADSPIRPYVVTAISRWQDAFLYGEFRATLVADSSTADVIVRNTPSDVGGVLLRRPILARAPQCNGETDPSLDPSSKTVQLPMHLFMYAVVSDAVPGIPACYSITMTHEVGHVIGILAHSPHSDDVMFANPEFDGISDRDRQTAITLYHRPSTVTVTGRR